jgi:hypothetical protein
VGSIALAGLFAAQAVAQTAAGPAYYTENSVQVVLSRGQEQTWTMTAPGGSYVAIARVNFRMSAGVLLGRDGTLPTDSRLKCRLDAEGRLSSYDEAVSLVTTDQVTGTGVVGQKSDDESFSLTAAVSPVSPGGDRTVVKVTCTNISVHERATNIAVDRVAVTLAPVSSIQGLPLTARAAPAAATATTTAAKPVTSTATAKPTGPVAPKPQ